MTSPISGAISDLQLNTVHIVD